MAQARRDELPVDVPDPRDVAAVGDAVVEREQQRGVAVGQDAQHLVGAGGVLDQQQHELGARRRAAAGSGRTRRGSARARRRSTVERLAEDERERGRGERVLDVVEAGQRELDAHALARRGRGRTRCRRGRAARSRARRGRAAPRALPQLGQGSR